MPVTLPWTEIAIRLLLTAFGAALIGLNRTEHGRPAGLRTTLLVALAAAISMIQANLLMDTVGKARDSFIVLDLMRLPLGILTGVGFIGAGAILRRENRVLGVTTAATMWFVTVMGLCFGGGQNGLGITAVILAIIVLWALKWVEVRLPQTRQGTLVLTLDPGGTADEMIRRKLLSAGFQIVSMGVAQDNVERRRELTCELRWQDRFEAGEKMRDTAIVNELSQLGGVSKLKWSPMGNSVGSE